MAGDVVSRIRLEASGGDQVAQELQKIKQESENVSEALEGIEGASIGGTSPFARATAGDDPVAQRGQRDLEAHRQEQMRLSDADRAATSQAQRPGGSLPGAVGGLSGAAQQTARGDPMSGAGGLLGTAASFLGPWGMVAAAGAAGVAGLTSLAGNEAERVQQLYDSGLAQRTGRGYEQTRALNIATARAGGAGRGRAFMEGVTGTGVGIDSGMETQLGLMQEVSMGTGVDAGLLGQLAGTMRQLDIDTSDLASQIRGMQAGVEEFGAAGLSPMMQAVSQQMSQAVQMGVTSIEAGQFRREADIMTRLGQEGMGVQGAAATYSRMADRGRQAAQLGAPEDMVALRSIMDTEGVGLTEAMMIMESDPTRASRDVLEHIERTSGNEDVARIRAQRFLGGPMSAAAGALGAFGEPPADEFVRTKIPGGGGRFEGPGISALLSEAVDTPELRSTLREVFGDAATSVYLSENELDELRKTESAARATSMREGMQPLEGLEQDLERARNLVASFIRPRGAVGDTSTMLKSGITPVVQPRDVEITPGDIEGIPRNEAESAARVLTNIGRYTEVASVVLRELDMSGAATDPESISRTLRSRYPESAAIERLAGQLSGLPMNTDAAAVLKDILDTLRRIEGDRVDE